MRTGITFDVVPEDLAQTLRETTLDRRAWVKPLVDGKMLRMSKRPQWVKADIAEYGMRLKTRAVGDHTDDIFVWLVPAPVTPVDENGVNPLVDNLAEMAGVR